MALGDTDATVRAVLADYPELPVLTDPDQTITSAYGIDVIPTTVFVDPSGRIAKVAVGPTTAEALAEIASALK